MVALRLLAITVGVFAVIISVAMANELLDYSYACESGEESAWNIGLGLGNIAVAVLGFVCIVQGLTRPDGSFTLRWAGAVGSTIVLGIPVWFLSGLCGL